MKPGLQPWEIDIYSFPKDGSMEEKIRWVLQFAVLAPSTHNSQPWLFKIEDESCKIFYDSQLRLPEGDPTGRDLYISFGCLIENLIVASEYAGLFEHVEYPTSFEANLVATVLFRQAEPKSELSGSLEAMKRRRNARGVFEKREIPQEIRKVLESISLPNQLYSHWIFDKDKIKAFAQLTSDGVKIAYQKKSFRKEVSQWMTNSVSGRFDGMPGYALRIPFFVSFVFPSIVKHFNISNRLGWLNELSISSAPGACVMTSEDNSPRSWIEVGRNVQRYFLFLYSKGLMASIFIASVEIGDLYKEVQRILETEKRPQFFFCFGYMDLPERHTPRHPIDQKIISG